MKNDKNDKQFLFYDDNKREGNCIFFFQKNVQNNRV